MPLARDEARWRAAGRRVFRLSVIAFAALGLLAGLAVARNGQTFGLGPYLVAGWQAVWVVTLLMAAAGALFGAVWLIIFRALAHASRS